MPASYLGAMGYAHQRDFPLTRPTPLAYNDPAISVPSCRDGIAECEFADAVRFDCLSYG